METTENQTENETFTVTVERVDDGIGEPNPYARFDSTHTSLLKAIEQAELARLTIEHDHAVEIANSIAYNMITYAGDPFDYTRIWIGNDEHNTLFINPDKPSAKCFYLRYCECPLDYAIQVVKD